MLGGDASKLCKDTQSVRQIRAAFGSRNGKPATTELKTNNKEIVKEERMEETVKYKDAT